MKDEQAYRAEDEAMTDAGANANPDAMRVFLSFGGNSGDRGSKQSSLSQPAVVAGFLVVVGAATLFSMRYFGPGSVRVDATAPVYTPSEFAASDAQRAEELIELLDRSAQPLQFPAEVMLASPFIDPVAPEEVVVVDAEAEAARLAAERLAELNSRIESFELQSVIGGRSPVARINGTIYQPGDLLDETFTIERITGRGVLLTADGRQFVLVPNAG